MPCASCILVEHGYPKMDSTNCTGFCRMCRFTDLLDRVAVRPTIVSDRRGWVRQFQYDNLGRNTAEIWYDSAADADADQNRQNTLTFTYDAAGHALTAGDQFADYGYTYDALGRAALIEHEIAGLTPMVSFAQQFDAAGRRTRLAAAVGSTADFLTDYVYDRLGRIDTIKQQGQGGAAVATKYVDFAFDAAGQPDGLKRYADSGGTQLVAETAWSFDGAGRLTGLTHAKGATTLADYDWQFDAAGSTRQLMSILRESRHRGRPGPNGSTRRICRLAYGHRRRSGASGRSSCCPPCRVWGRPSRASRIASRL